MRRKGNGILSKEMGEEGEKMNEGRKVKMRNIQVSCRESHRHHYSQYLIVNSLPWS